MINKKIISLILIGFILLGGTIGLFAATKSNIWINSINKNDVIEQVSYPIYVNEQKINMMDNGKEQPVLSYNGRTYVPLRKIAEIVGAESNSMWDARDSSNPHIDIVKSLPEDYIQINTFYNGAYVKYSIQTNQEISNKAIEITQNSKSKENKAWDIYKFVMGKLWYDYALIDDNGNGTNVGAIFAYNNNRGICYDYACLYTVMAKAAGLNVRLVTGFVPVPNTDGGFTLSGHAWNEVMGTDGRWIPVDATFGDTAESDVEGWDFEEYDMEKMNPEANVAYQRYTTALAVEYISY